MNEKYRLHLIWDGRDFYSKTVNLSGTDFKSLKEVKEYYYKHLAGDMNKFTFELQDGSFLLLNSLAIKNSIIIIESIGG